MVENLSDRMIGDTFGAHVVTAGAILNFHETADGKPECSTQVAYSESNILVRRLEIVIANSLAYAARDREQHRLYEQRGSLIYSPREMQRTWMRFVEGGT